MDRLNEDTVQLHTVMLNDRRRTERFIAAVQRAVRPGDVVVDLGTGTGILALAAARAGARHVYAIESGPVRHVATRLLGANGAGDRVTVIGGYSTRIELPERADVLITETFGHSALAERVLQSTTDARRRLLKPDARVVPGALRIYALPVTLPERFIRHYVPTEQNAERWREWYDIDWEPLRAVNDGVMLLYHVDPRDLRGARPLAEPVLLADIDLATRDKADVRTTTTAAVHRRGALNGVILYFELQLAPDLVLSTRPGEAADNHWLNPVYLLAHPIQVPAKGVLKVSYGYSARRNRERINVSLAP